MWCAKRTAVGVAVASSARQSDRPVSVESLQFSIGFQSHLADQVVERARVCSLQVQISISKLEGNAEKMQKLLEIWAGSEACDDKFVTDTTEYFIIGLKSQCTKLKTEIRRIEGASAEQLSDLNTKIEKIEQKIEDPFKDWREQLRILKTNMTRSDWKSYVDAMKAEQLKLLDLNLLATRKAESFPARQAKLLLDLNTKIEKIDHNNFEDFRADLTDMKFLTFEHDGPSSMMAIEVIPNGKVEDIDYVEPITEEDKEQTAP